MRAALRVLSCVFLPHALAGCTTSDPSPPVAAEVVIPPAGPAMCEPFSPDPGGPLSLERAAEAHRRAELRRHLRMEEALEPGFLFARAGVVADDARIRGGEVACATLREIGRLVFDHEYTYADGLGAPFRRVQKGLDGGPETNACRSCHWRGGPAGAGSLLDNVLLLGDGDRISSADARNPPPLVGLGVVELLAAEMSADLQRQLDAAILGGPSAGPVSLETKGVSFGSITVGPDGAVDTSAVEGIDADLVIKPFGWKGNFTTVAEFARGSIKDHLTLEVGEGPLTEGLLTALLMYLVTLDLPGIVLPVTARDLPSAGEPRPPPTAFEYADEWADGLLLFEDIGCAHCHRRELVLEDSVLEIGGVQLDLAEDVGLLQYDPTLGGYPVRVFSDLKRHDLGDAARSQHVHRGVDQGEYLTRRLLGLNGSLPYFHDGRAPFLDHAIAAHGGEASFARAAFEALDRWDKGRLRIYLMSLRRHWQVVIN